MVRRSYSAAPGPARPNSTRELKLPHISAQAREDHPACPQADHHGGTVLPALHVHHPRPRTRSIAAHHWHHRSGWIGDARGPSTSGSARNCGGTCRLDGPERAAATAGLAPDHGRYSPGTHLTGVGLGRAEARSGRFASITRHCIGPVARTRRYPDFRAAGSSRSALVSTREDRRS
jgi:hypothetical protein